MSGVHDMCYDCSSGVGERSNFYVFLGEKIEKKIEFVEKDDVCEVGLKCSCCGVEFIRKGVEFDISNNNDNNNDNDNNNNSSCFVINSSWDLLKFEKDLNSVVDVIGSGEKYDLEDVNEVKFVVKETEETEETEDLIKFHEKEGQDLEFLLDYSGNQLVSIESIDEDHEFGDFQKAQDVLESKTEIVTEDLLQEKEERYSVLEDADEKRDELSKFVELDSMEFEETENSLVFHVNSCDFTVEKPAISETIQASSDSKDVQHIEGSDSDHEEAEVSIGTEIPVLDSCDEIKAQDNFNLYTLSHEEEPSSSSHDLDFNLESGFQEARDDEKLEELKNLNQEVDTLLVIERKDSMVDESFDGSEMDGVDPINTTEKLKSALRAERKALQELYTELEEERSASAVAASETMAMINRLQEEKAAMQMEALHYQRMMEEQSEYDQEALQLLNELMVKKEKELELYRKKVLDYETKERMRFLSTSTKSGTCSASCSHSEDGDGMWVDLSHEPKEESRNHNTPVDTIMNLDSSFMDFEDERLSILEQLKVLEEKLFALSDEEDRHFSNFRQIEDYFEENGKHLNNGQQVNGIANGFPKEPLETRYQDRRNIGSTGKRLLPLFDALENESDEGVITSNGHENGFHSDKVEDVAITRFELQKKRIDIEEEVDQLYVRLQALEADREFLKHCIGSLKKGDKGMELLQEILQHLRDLRNVDLREKSFTDGTLV
ncbi:hypothetical protein M8C21_030427 [Ambrosia artemisiifolia]|uniref:GTD-binding domain-containing protein n=1 Tax=Ambrosia artemisiifolia TaxID=4212 RepID=A0AAD5CCY3_AMBAR|nr:hypothetical protein M8C21_030427 [Ambrosia artemisiifolia]